MGTSNLIAMDLADRIIVVFNLYFVNIKDARPMIVS